MRLSKSCRLLPSLVLFLCLACTGIAQWSSLPSLANYRLAAQYAYLDSTLYIFGGYGPGGGTAFQKDSWKLDLRNGTAWAPIAPLPEPRFGGYAAVYNGRIYLMGGLSSNGSVIGEPTVYTTDVLEYDPVADSYTEKSQIPLSVTNAASVTIGSRVYMVAGPITLDNGTVDSMSTLVYDMATNIWTRASSAPRGVNGASAAAVGSTIYLVGGLGADGIIEEVNKGVVDGGTITWSTVASYPVRAQLTAAGELNGRVYVTGGVSPDDPDGKLDATYYYDQGTGEWIAAENLPVATHSNPVLLNGGDALYYIGSSQNPKVFRYRSGVSAGGVLVEQRQFVLTLVKGESRELETTVTNTTTGNIDVAVDLGGASGWLSTPSPTFTIPAGGSAPLKLGVTTGSLAAGSYKGTATLQIGGNSVPVKVRLWVLDALVSQPTNVALEYTSSTAVGLSIDALDTVRAIQSRHPGRVIALSYHGYQGDSLEVQEGTSLLTRLAEPYALSYPSAAVQRGTIPGHVELRMIFTSQWEGAVNDALADTPEAPFALSIGDMAFDAATMRVTGNVRIIPTRPIEAGNGAGYRMTVVVVEDSVDAPQKGTAGVISPYYQMRVVRSMWPDENGAPVVIAPSVLDEGFITPGAVITQPISLSAARVARPAQAHLVVLLHTDAGERPGEIVQAIDVPLMQSQSGLAAGELAGESAAAPRVYPNPGSGTLSVAFTVARSCHARLSLLDPLGHVVATLLDGRVDAGEHRLAFDAARYPSGVYLLHLDQGGSHRTGVMVIRR